MHVLMISDVYFPRINGVSTSIQTFRKHLADASIDVTLVAPSYWEKEVSHTTEGPSTSEGVIRLPATSIPFDPEDRLMHRQALKNLPATLADKHFDLIHVQTPFAAHYTGLNLARARGIPCIATYHTHFEEYFHHYLPILPRPMARGLTRRIARSQCNALDAVVVPSSAMQSALERYGVHRPLHIIPTGIPLADFQPPAVNDFRQRHQLPEDAPLALFVGRVAHEKNLGFLLEATAHALKHTPDFHLVIAGEGPALPGLRKLAAKLGLNGHVHFLGYLDRQEALPACYAAADLFVFPSLTETQGLVLLEAMAAGLPVLGIPAMGAADILLPAQGAVCAPSTVDGFGDLMAKMINDPARLATLSASAKTFAQAWGAPERAAQLATLYHSLASQPRLP